VQYDSKLPVMVNVNLPDSLLSRFDLMFIVLDTGDPEIVCVRAPCSNGLTQDRNVADQVVRNHRYIPRSGEGLEDFGDGIAVTSSDQTNVCRVDAVLASGHELLNLQVFQRYDRVLHGTYSKRKDQYILTTGPSVARAVAS
jgi:DNA replication licensing factor MCM3